MVITLWIKLQKLIENWRGAPESFMFLKKHDIEIEYKLIRKGGTVLSSVYQYIKSGNHISCLILHLNLFQ